MLNIILIGAPCSGKGTQSEKLTSLFDLVHISTGEVFRDEIKRKTSIGKAVQSYIDKGELVPDRIVLKAIYHIVNENTDALGVIFDGFPRTKHQSLILEKSLKKRKLNISLVIFIDVEEDELVKRLKNRNKNSDRSDDSFEILRKRIDVYKEQTLPLLEYYKNKQKLFRVSGMAPVDTVFGDICEVINKFIKETNKENKYIRK